MGGQIAICLRFQTNTSVTGEWSGLTSKAPKESEEKIIILRFRVSNDINKENEYQCICDTVSSKGMSRCWPFGPFAKPICGPFTALPFH